MLTVVVVKRKRTKLSVVSFLAFLSGFFWVFASI